MELIDEKYTLTEVGLIPTDWKVKELSEITSLVTNGFVGIATTHYTDAIDGVIYIQGFNVEENSFNFSGIKKVTLSFHKQHSKSSLRKDDLLTIQTGEIGLTTIVPNYLEGSNCHALIITRFHKGKTEPKFFSYYFNSFIGKIRFKEIETGSTMKHINVSDMIHLKVPFPPKEEQTAIATALSDADALITATEKLIAKKRDIKQSAMQKLLAPKKNWEVKRLGEVCNLFGRIGFRGYSVSDIVKEHEGAISLSPSNIIDGEMNLDRCTYISWAKYHESPEIKVSPNDIVLVKTASIGKSTLVKESPEPMTVNPQLVVIKDIVIDPYFLSCIISHKDFQKQLKSKVVGGVVATLSQEEIKNFELRVPSIQLQKEISITLSSMDAEIAVLEKKLSKYRMIKQGMMQNLLTGKIRLV